MPFPKSLWNLQPEGVAMSLENYHRGLFAQLEETDLLEPSSKIKQYNNSPQIANYVTASILDAQTATERVKRIEFWIEVLEACDTKYHDHVAIIGIIGALQNITANLWYTNSLVDEVHKNKLELFKTKYDLRALFIRDAELRKEGSEVLPFVQQYLDRAGQLKDAIDTIEYCKREIPLSEKTLKEKPDNPDEIERLQKLQEQLINNEKLKVKASGILDPLKKDIQKARKHRTVPVAALSGLEEFSNNAEPDILSLRKLEPTRIHTFKTFLDKGIERAKKQAGEKSPLFMHYTNSKRNLLENFNTQKNQSIPELQNIAAELYLQFLQEKITQLEKEPLPTEFINDLRRTCVSYKNACDEAFKKNDKASFAWHLSYFQTTLESTKPPSAWDLRGKSHVAALKDELKEQISLGKGLKRLDDFQKHAEAREAAAKQEELKSEPNEVSLSSDDPEQTIKGPGG